MGSVDIYYHPLFLQHETGEHPENKQRLIVATETLEASGLALDWLTPEPASVEAVARIHDRSYIETIRRIAEEGGGWLDLDTAVSPASYDAAMLAAGAGLQAVERGMQASRAAFLLVRPPGHHARSAKGMGFCLFNNIAVAAAYALAELDVERVLIVDWDVHHGNGTHESFYSEQRVLFFSMHEANHFPGTGFADEVGEGDGRGYTINLPLRAGAGDGAVQAAFETLLLPVARQFRPQLVLVSAGFDAQRGDPLGDLCFSQASFQWMAARLAALCNDLGVGAPIMFLEGGYAPRMMAASIVATLQGVQGDEPAFSPSLSLAEQEDLERTLTAIRPFWPGVL